MTLEIANLNGHERDQMIALFIAVVAATAAAESAAPLNPSTTTYYVSPTGSDTADGTTPASAWQTLQRASAATAATTAAGTTGGGGVTLLLARNGTWLNDPLALDAGGNAITVGAYGDTTLPRPLLQHARGLNAAGSACVSLSNLGAGGAAVRDLHVGGCARGLVLSAAGAGTVARNVEVSGNVFRDIRTPFLRYTPPNPSWAPAIFLSPGHFANLTVNNNVAVRIDVFFQSSAHTETFNLDGNTVQQCSGNCYSFGAGVGLTMQNSVLLRDMSERLPVKTFLQNTFGSSNAAAFGHSYRTARILIPSRELCDSPTGSCTAPRTSSWAGSPATTRCSTTTSTRAASTKAGPTAVRSTSRRPRPASSCKGTRSTGAGARAS